MFSGPMPNITPAQIVAVIGNVIAVAVAFGLHLSKQQEDEIGRASCRERVYSSV